MFCIQYYYPHVLMTTHLNGSQLTMKMDFHFHWAGLQGNKYQEPICHWKFKQEQIVCCLGLCIGVGVGFGISVGISVGISIGVGFGI
eukprot:g37047.t1